MWTASERRRRRRSGEQDNRAAPRRRKRLSDRDDPNIRRTERRMDPELVGRIGRDYNVIIIIIIRCLMCKSSKRVRLDGWIIAVRLSPIG